jgi:hypothetical protein
MDNENIATKRWEYCYIETDGDSVYLVHAKVEGSSRDEYLLGELPGVIALLGLNGWEVVNASAYFGIIENIFFKRELR